MPHWESRMRRLIRTWTKNFETFVLQVLLRERRDFAATVARPILSLLSLLFVVILKLRTVL